YRISSTVFLSFVTLISMFYSLMTPLLTNSTLFPYTTLFRSINALAYPEIAAKLGPSGTKHVASALLKISPSKMWGNWQKNVDFLDRKSTRLNSSHVKISYAVFCLKKKKKRNNQTIDD